MQSSTSPLIVLWISMLSWFPTEDALIHPTAKQFLDGINAAVDPCDDFYEYSCGKWIATQTEKEVDQISILDAKTRKVGKDLLSGKIIPKGTTFDAEVRAKSLYQQCTNQAAIEELHGSPVIDILKDVLGGWPLIARNWNATNFNLIETLVNSHYLGSTSLFSVGIGANVEDPSRNLIKLDASKLVVDADLLQDKDSAPKYLRAHAMAIQNVTKKLLRDANSTNDIKLLEANITDIVQTENYLGLNMLTRIDTNNETTWLNKFSLRQFKDHFRFNSSLLRNITECLQSFFVLANRSHATTEDTVIIVPSLRYWPKLDEKLVELDKQGDEGRRRLASYIGWKLIYSLLDYLSEEYRIFNEGNPAAYMEENCLNIIKKAMPLALGALYVRDIVPYDLREKALLEEASWMDNATYEGALHKLAAIRETVAYPDIMANNMSVIDAQYQSITVEKAFFHTVLEMNMINIVQQMRQLTRTRAPSVARVTSTLDISKIGAGYDWGENQLTIQAGILRLPFFDASAPQYLNYGGLGYVIGHEFTHGFDDTGAMYDSVGERRLWWTNKTLDTFKNRANTIVEQYSRYAMPTGNVNGALTVGENIADNGGLRASLKGYTRYLQRLKTPEPVLLGMEKFTPLQLFFLSAAQPWCEKRGPDSERLQLLMNLHAPGKWRVNGPMSNIPELSKASTARASPT